MTPLNENEQLYHSALVNIFAAKQMEKQMFSEIRSSINSGNNFISRTMEGFVDGTLTGKEFKEEMTRAVMAILDVLGQQPEKDSEYIQAIIERKGADTTVQ